MSDSKIKSNAYWKDRLTPEQYEVCRNKGTERAFTGEYHETKDEGIYQCICCGADLFRSEHKYDSGSGWPSFFQPIGTDVVTLKPDNTLFMKRVEVVCSRCDSHLGHIFDDGPPPTGKRFCMNSVALHLKRAEKK